MNEGVGVGVSPPVEESWVAAPSPLGEAGVSALEGGSRCAESGGVPGSKMLPGRSAAGDMGVARAMAIQAQHQECVFECFMAHFLSVGATPDRFCSGEAAATARKARKSRSAITAWRDSTLLSNG